MCHLWWICALDSGWVLFGPKCSWFFSVTMPCHEDVWWNGGIAPHILNLGTRGGEWTTLHPCCFTPGQRAPFTHSIEGWEDPRFSLDISERRKTCPYWESNPSRLAHSLVSILTELSHWVLGLFFRMMHNPSPMFKIHNHLTISHFMLHYLYSSMA
jgi:hypothetical protein